MSPVNVANATSSLEVPVAALEPASACPAVLLKPVWESRGKTEYSTDIDCCFDVGGIAGFTLCARVRQIPSSGDEGSRSRSRRILQRGDPPRGWTFAAPSTTGVVAFSSGSREVVATGVGDDVSATDEDKERVDAERPPRGDDDIGQVCVDDGAWHHVAVVFDGNKVRSLVDGVPDGEAIIQVNPASAATALTLGTSEEECAEGGTAELEDVQIFGDALTDTQIAAICSRSREIPTGITLPMLPSDVIEFQRIQASTDEKDAGDQDCRGKAASRNLLYEALKLGTSPEAAFQDEVVCNMFVDLLDHTTAICFNARKAAVAVAILREILAAMHRRSATANCIGEPITVSEAFTEFKRLVVAHANTSLPVAGRFGVFSVADARQLTEFMSTALFQHFVLFQCVLVRPSTSTTQHSEAIIELPAPPRDLQRGHLVTKTQRARLLAGQGPRKTPNTPADLGKASPAWSTPKEAEACGETGDGGLAAGDHPSDEPPSVEPEEPAQTNLDTIMDWATKKAVKQMDETIDAHNKQFEDRL
eukprot:TRINITY_DN15827_c0_g2_i1.p1 TRINITY_DN15827_c0_g2~~TRINITY_DN15827_c0_g2_i1.p1  ORF type:complete len:533 (-),score=100.05 TRINITY_DN15827_c0_g2_i1:1482-3080(-)